MPDDSPTGATSGLTEAEREAMQRGLSTPMGLYPAVVQIVNARVAAAVDRALTERDTALRAGEPPLAFAQTVIYHRRLVGAIDGCTECGGLPVGSSFTDHLWQVYRAALPEPIVPAQAGDR